MAPALFFLGLILLIILVAKSLRSSRVNEVYERLARRYHGTAYRGNLLYMPHLRFVYKGAHALLDTLYSSFPSRLRSYTQFHISWPDHELKLEIVAAKMSNKLRRLLGSRAVRIGSPHFDRYYHVTGEDHDAVREFLSGGVQHVIDQLRHLTLKTRNLRITIRDGIMVIRKPGSMREVDELSRLLRLGLELFNQAMLTRSAGIEIVDESLVVTSGEATCTICGDEIEAGVVFCMRCRTPHHHECWQYYGQCSTYGCGETRYTRY